MKQNIKPLVGRRRTRKYLSALDRLGLSVPVVKIDHIPDADEFDDCLSIAQWADVIIHDRGHEVAVLMSVDRYRRLNPVLKPGHGHDA